MEWIFEVANIPKDKEKHKFPTRLSVYSYTAKWGNAIGCAGVGRTKHCIAPRAFCLGRGGGDSVLTDHPGWTIEKG